MGLKKKKNENENEKMRINDTWGIIIIFFLRYTHLTFDYFTMQGLVFILKLMYLFWYSINKIFSNITSFVLNKTLKKKKKKTLNVDDEIYYHKGIMSSFYRCLTCNMAIIYGQAHFIIKDGFALIKFGI